jgi:hypothetical protein
LGKGHYDRRYAKALLETAFSKAAILMLVVAMISVSTYGSQFGT